jgi:WD40 repeat protein
MRIVTVGNDSTARIWDVASGKTLRVLEGPLGILSADFSPDGRNVLTSSPHNCVIRDVENGKILHEITYDDRDIKDAVYSPDGKIILISAENYFSCWDASTGKLLHKLDSLPYWTEGLIFSPGGKYITADAIKDNQHFTFIWETGSGRLLDSIQVFSDMEIRRFQSIFSPVCADDPGGGRYILINSPDSSAEMWETATSRRLYSLKAFSGVINNVCFSPDGKSFITAGADNLANIRDTRSGKLIKILKGHDSGIFNVRYSPDGKLIITAGLDNSVIIWKAATGKILTRSLNNYSYEPYTAEFSPPNSKDPSGGKYFATVNDLNYDLRIWETATGNQLSQFDGYVSYQNKHSVFSPDGKWIVMIPGASGDVSIHECPSGYLLHSLKGLTSNVKSACFSPDGKYFLTAQDSTAKMWDCSTLKLNLNLNWLLDDEHKESFSLMGGINDIYFARFSPSCIDDPQGGRYILTVSRDETSRIFERSTGKLLFTFQGQDMSAQFSYDGRYLLTTQDSTAKTWECGTWSLMQTFTGKGYGAFQYAELSPDNRYLLSIPRWYGLMSGNHVISLWEVSTGKLIHAFEDETGFSCAHFSPANPEYPAGGKYILLTSLMSTTVWETATIKKLYSFQGFRDGNIDFSADGKNVLLASGDSVVEIRDILKGNVVTRLTGKNKRIFFGSYSTNGKTVITLSEDGTIRLWNPEGGKLLRNYMLKGGSIYDINWKDSIIITHENSVLTFSKIKDGEEVFSHISIDSCYSVDLTPDMYFMADKEAANTLTWRIGSQLYSYEQFDLQYNRPDIVLERLWNPDSSLIKMYRNAYEKRLKKSGFDEKVFSPGWHTPEIKILNAGNFNFSMASPELKLSLCGTDSKYKLDRINVWVNNVPVFGMRGISVRAENSDSIVRTIPITLTAGSNRIQVSCMNEKGVESLKGKMTLAYNPEKLVLPDLYIIVMSVSDYKDNRFNLQYSVKDGRDIAGLFNSINISSGKERFSHINIDTLFNKRAVKENFFKLRKKLFQTKPDDQIVLYVSGHGLLDSKLDFYFATWDIDFSNPETRGISFSDLESLLDSIPARKKLMMMDACHSGEIDKEESTILAESDSDSSRNVTFRGKIKELNFKGVDRSEAQSGLGLNSSFDMMQELFSGLDKGTGTVVISAAAGKGYALESPEWNNGVFTYSIVDGLNNFMADRNGDGNISISELKNYSIKQVELLTGGKQKPTARRESGEFDWIIW